MSLWAEMLVKWERSGIGMPLQSLVKRAELPCLNLAVLADLVNPVINQHYVKTG